METLWAILLTRGLKMSCGSAGNREYSKARDRGVKVKRKEPLVRLLVVLIVGGLIWFGLRVTDGGNSHFAAKRVGRVENNSLTEVSGIAISRKNPGVIWAHNDSGDGARLFAMKIDGTHLGTFSLPGARAIDFEDLAIGPGPEQGVDYLYVADTGNNELTRKVVAVYRVPEPAVALDGDPVSQRLEGVEELPMNFPQGRHECETLMVDPLTSDLYLVTRNRRASGAGFSTIFRNPAPQETGVPVTLEAVTRFAVPAEIKGGDMSRDGQMILLRPHSMNRRRKAILWRWDRTESLSQTLAQPGAPVAAAFERQGEAIAFSPDGQSYYTVGEGLNATIYRYSVPDAASAGR
jgi:hypothetical protein